MIVYSYTSRVRMAAERSVWILHGKLPCLVVEIHCFGIRFVICQGMAGASFGRRKPELCRIRLASAPQIVSGQK